MTVSSATPRSSVAALLRPVRWRLAADFQLAVVSLFGGCAAFAILPFALYRLFTGQWLIATIDAALTLSIGGAALYAWFTGDTRRAGVFLIVINTAGCVLVSLLMREIGLFWMYVVLLSNFFLTDSRTAALANLLAVLAVMILPGAFASTLQQMVFLVTATVVSLFALIFARLTEGQRRQLEALARRDPLTGVGNRRAMDEALSQAASRSRDRNALGLMMLDVDHFKQVNDRYGHEAGDQVLVTIAQLLESHRREGDRVFRFGGEEFVVLLGGVDDAALLISAERLRRLCQDELAEPRAITVSIGAARLCPGETPAAWLLRADAALYRAKSAGRNRVEMATVENEAAGTDDPVGAATAP